MICIFTGWRRLIGIQDIKYRCTERSVPIGVIDLEKESLVRQVL